jgi:hypothetical protein
MCEVLSLMGRPASVPVCRLMGLVQSRRLVQCDA